MTLIEATTAVLSLREPPPKKPIATIQPGRFAPQYAEPGQPDNVEHHTDPAHEALFKHDTAVAESHKAIIQGQHAMALEDRVAAKTRLIDAAKGHKHAARQITRLSDQLRNEPKRGKAATMARQLAASHRDAAQKLEESALGGSLLKARKAVSVADRQAKTLSRTLGVKPKLPKPKPEPEAEAEMADDSRIEPGILEVRDWAKWHAEHPYVHHPRQKHGRPDVDEGSAHRPKGATKLSAHHTGTPVAPPRAGKPGVDYPIKTNDVDEAARLLGEGKKVELDSPRTVSTLLDKLATMVHDAVEKGDKAPDYNLCNVSVPKTNLFCASSKGIPRIEMPQLAGIPRPGSPADKLPKNKKGEVDLSDMFRRQLELEGHKITDTQESAAHLKASQNYLNGVKVAGMVQSLRVGKLPPGRVFTSADNYIVDGHHRWAANVGESLGSSKDLQMDIARVDMPIIDLLDAANKFADQMGIEHQRIDQLELLIRQLREAMDETRDWKLWDEEHRGSGRLHRQAMRKSQRLLEGTGSPAKFREAAEAHRAAAAAFRKLAESHTTIPKAVEAYAVAHAHEAIARHLLSVPEDRQFDQSEIEKLRGLRIHAVEASARYREVAARPKVRPPTSLTVPPPPHEGRVRPYRPRPPRQPGAAIHYPSISVTGGAPKPHHHTGHSHLGVLPRLPTGQREDGDADPLAMAQVRAWLWES